MPLLHTGCKQTELDPLWYVLACILQFSIGVAAGKWPYPIAHQLHCVPPCLAGSWGDWYQCTGPCTAQHKPQEPTTLQSQLHLAVLPVKQLMGMWTRRPAPLLLVPVWTVWEGESRAGAGESLWQLYERFEGCLQVGLI